MPTTASIRPATPPDLAPVLELLREAGLSIPGVEEHFGDFLVAERGGRIVGAIGLELRGEHALLRSAVVLPGERSAGVGAELFRRIQAVARSKGVTSLVLLTSSAEGYWARHGFERIAREAAPAAVRVSAEFNGSCPASAAVMRLGLG